MAEVKEIRKVSCIEELTKLEMTQYRKMVGNRVAQSTRLDLCYTSLRIAKRNIEAKIMDLKNINIRIEFGANHFWMLPLYNVFLARN